MRLPCLCFNLCLQILTLRLDQSVPYVSPLYSPFEVLSFTEEILLSNFILVSLLDSVSWERIPT